MKTALQNTIDAIIYDATLLQNKASDPRLNIWVNASAGTGKTKVLTDRVLRLLLPVEGRDDGIDPQNIVCITFTKAGANEMITRVMKILSKWAVCSEKNLFDDLEKLLGHVPTINQKDKARKLFATVIDTPGGLNITTIHAFCQSILGRFTIEANLPPNFKVIEENESRNLLIQARDDLIKEILNRKSESTFYKSFEWLSAYYNGEQIQKIIQSFISQKKFIQAVDIEHYETRLTQVLSVQKNDDYESIYKLYLSEDTYPKTSVEKIAATLMNGSKNQIDSANFLMKFCHANFEKRKFLLDEYFSVFMTTEGKIKNFPAPLTRSNPDVEVLFLDEADRIKKLYNHLSSLRILEASMHMVVIAKNIIGRYEELKMQKQVVDYDDLIDKTQQLLSGPMRDWVLFKLDFNIDHLLVDEAQDTSPNQWDIIMAIIEEFYSGLSDRNEKINRTSFVVGDTKQSIFSFQGANPAVYGATKTKVENLVLSSGKPFLSIPMNTSFRSMPAILNVVDCTFNDAQMKYSLTQNSDDYGSHSTKWQGQSGVVEFWPLYKSETIIKDTPWTLPISVVENQDALSTLAKRIALHIKQMIDKKEVIQSKGRSVTAGDIMILVRRRNAMVEHLIRAFKACDIPVSGADRLVISNHIAVQDVMALLQFILLPEDDLNLAILLKSPLIGMNDFELEELAYGRESSLWRSIQEKGSSKLYDYLSKLIANLSGKNSFSSISDILNMESFIDGYNGWQAFIMRLGHDCLDPLEELLTIAQSYDAKSASGGLQGFVYAMQTNSSEIKRELEHGSGMVRIMTVHASKGLQAPIVICPDSTSLPKSSGQSGQSFLWIEDDFPLWAPSQTSHEMIDAHRKILDQKIYDEYNRLLYVAMTRAEDRLIICGTLNKKQNKIPEKSWYESVLNGILNAGGSAQDWGHDIDFIAKNFDNKYLKFETELVDDVQYTENNQIKLDNPDIPLWLTHDLPQENFPPKILKPSKLEDEDVPVRSPLLQGNEDHRFRRGLLTHSLLQYLPNLPLDKRETVGQGYLLKQANELSVQVRDSILKEVLEILKNAEFAPYFGEGSMAEVPLTGKVLNAQGKYDIIAGQIDRMLVTKDAVWIVDFKSNRPPPKDLKDIPTVYKNQLKAYKSLIRDIYPHHQIHCGLLWTDGPYMTELKDL